MEMHVKFWDKAHGTVLGVPMATLQEDFEGFIDFKTTLFASMFGAIPTDEIVTPCFGCIDSSAGCSECFLNLNCSVDKSWYEMLYTCYYEEDYVNCIVYIKKIRDCGFSDRHKSKNGISNIEKTSIFYKKGVVS